MYLCYLISEIAYWVEKNAAEKFLFAFFLLLPNSNWIEGKCRKGSGFLEAHAINSALLEQQEQANAYNFGKSQLSDIHQPDLIFILQIVLLVVSKMTTSGPN